MEAVRSLLAQLGLDASSIQDTLKVVFIGGTVETARRACSGIVDSFYLTAHFSQEDYPYDWLMHWLSKQPEWGRSREFDITTRSVGQSQLLFNPKVTSKPSPGATHTVFYRGHCLKITPTRSYQGFGDYSNIKISVIARRNDILKRLVLEAKREYEKDAERRVHMFTADAQRGRWKWNGKRPERSWTSIILKPGVKEMLLADCQDFLRSEDWYAERGMPFRRGYLLYGAPRSGKTSVIYSLAGELGLEIYVLILTSKGMCDNILESLMKDIPSRCILLLEDLDAALACGTTSTGSPTVATEAAVEGNGGSTLSLNGLVTSLFPADSGEGRLIVVTTNHIERLDPALRRPGRLDVGVEFTHANKWQSERIFNHFFLSRPSTSSPDEAPREPQPQPGSEAPARGVPILAEEEIVQLAQRFADAIPEGEISVAGLEWYLVKNKTRPRECVEDSEVRELIEREHTTPAGD